MKEVLASVPTSNKKNLEQVQEIETLHNNLKKLIPDYDSVNRIKDKELPDIQSKLDDIKQQLESINSTVDKVNFLMVFCGVSKRKK